MKGVAKRVLGTAYPMLVKARTSEAVRACSAAAGYLPYRLNRRTNGCTFAIDIHGAIGIGAVIVHSLKFHRHAEVHRMTPAIISTNPLYASHPGNDFLALYFNRPPIAATLKPLRGNGYNYAYRYGVDRHMPLEEAGRLFARYFPPNERLATVIAEVKGGRTAFDASIHFRGTDKVLESGDVDHGRMFSALDRLIDELGRPGDIFLATDDGAFEAAVRARYARCTFTTFNIGTLVAGVARHFSTMPPDDKAMEALANIFLIASAPLCIRTSSYLSAISKFARPMMRTVTVNRTLNGSTIFPEREIVLSEG
jgi:hypothetical protein